MTNKKIEYNHYINLYYLFWGDRNILIYSIRNDWETNEKLALRYKKLFFQSRIASKLKSERYFVKKQTKRIRREIAIVREHYRYLNKKVYF